MWEASTIEALTRGTSGLLLGYASVEVSLLAGLRKGRASVGKWLLSPLAAVPATLVADIGMSGIGAAMRAVGFGDGLITAAGIGASLGAGYLTGRLLARSPAPPTVHRRGAVVLDAPAAESARTAQGRARERSQHLDRGGLGRVAGKGAAAVPAITLGGVPLSLEDETKHFKIIGTTGTGKSTAIREILGTALARGDRAIIADPDGGYLARFYDAKRGDVILNPFDSRSVKWDLFGEITTAYDVEQLARSLIPDQGGSDRSWTGYARTFFTAVTRQAHAQGVRDLGELYRLLVVAPASELRQLVAGTAAQPFLEEQNARMFDSIRSVTGSAVAALDYVAQQQATGFSIREWVREGARRRSAGAEDVADSLDSRRDLDRDRFAGGVLFIPYRAGEIAALRSTISAWMRVGIFEAMNQPEGDQRLWFVVDELDALGTIDGLKDALARLRKFGGRIVLGLQSIAQVSATYGREAQTMVENSSNTLIMRSSGSEHGGTSQFASRLIGERELIRTSVSRSRRPTDFFASTSYSEHVETESAVLDSEIEQLPDLEGYLKIASLPYWQRIRLSFASQARSTASVSAPATAAAGPSTTLPEPGSAGAVTEEIRRGAVNLWQRARSSLLAVAAGAERERNGDLSRSRREPVSRADDSDPER